MFELFKRRRKRPRAQEYRFAPPAPQHVRDVLSGRMGDRRDGLTRLGYRGNVPVDSPYCLIQSEDGQHKPCLLPFNHDGRHDWDHGVHPAHDLRVDYYRGNGYWTRATCLRCGRVVEGDEPRDALVQRLD